MLTKIAALALQFGRVNRATFHEDGVTPESDTDHTVMLVLLAIHIASKNPDLGLDRGRLALLGTVHDFPEVYAGDTNTTGGLTDTQKADKATREAAALDRLEDELGGGPIVRLIQQYEWQQCPESRFLRYLDKITPKLTHALNGNVAILRAGHSVEWLRERHRTQGAELAEKYPEFAGVLGPLFDAACAESEAVLAKSLAPTQLGCDCYPGCWADHSRDWPAIEFATEAEADEAWRRCHQTEVLGVARPDRFPYGSYVVIGRSLRFGSVALMERAQSEGIAPSPLN